MSKNISNKKVVPTTARTKSAPGGSKIKITDSGASGKGELVFTRTNYLIGLAGIFCITLGLVLMSGGNMPSPDVWDESIIYSPRRVLVGPIIILAGLILEIVAIFYNPGPADNGVKK